MCPRNRDRFRARSAVRGREGLVGLAARSAYEIRGQGESVDAESRRDIPAYPRPELADPWPPAATSRTTFVGPVLGPAFTFRSVSAEDSNGRPATANNGSGRGTRVSPSEQGLARFALVRADLPISGECSLAASRRLLLGRGRRTSARRDSVASFGASTNSGGPVTTHGSTRSAG